MTATIPDDRPAGQLLTTKQVGYLKIAMVVMALIMAGLLAAIIWKMAQIGGRMVVGGASSPAATQVAAPQTARAPVVPAVGQTGASAAPSVGETAFGASAATRLNPPLDPRSRIDAFSRTGTTLDILVRTGKRLEIITVDPATGERVQTVQLR
ncbi:MAG: hypothetical protein AAFO79_04230 [Pseudomonadota bacterium]